MYIRRMLSFHLGNYWLILFSFVTLQEGLKGPLQFCSEKLVSSTYKLQLFVKDDTSWKFSALKFDLANVMSNTG